MEVTVKREDLVRGLYLVQGVVERRTPQPILSHVLIEPADGGIALVATDMEVGLRAVVPATVRKKAAVTVNARKLYEIARELTADELTLKSSTQGWVDVASGRSRFKVVSLEPKDFPELPFGQTATGVPVRLAAGTLREMIDRTLFAVSSDETRYNLSGVYVEAADGGVLRFVATDGHRLALVDRALAEVKLGRGVIMPRKGLVEVRKLLDETGEAEVTLLIGEKDVQITTPHVAFFMRLVEGEFPDYRQVIPSAPRVKALVNRDDLVAALRRTSLLASERSNGVKVKLEKGSMELSASNPELGEASEDIEASYAGESIAVGFNGRYLLEALNQHAAGDTVELGLTDEVGPGLLKGSQDPNYTYVIMPMRL